VLPALDRIIAGYQADHGTGRCTDQCSFRRITGFRFLRIRVQRLAPGERSRSNHDHYRQISAIHFVSSFFAQLSRRGNESGSDTEDSISSRRSAIGRYCTRTLAEHRLNRG
jgi:hypothetical protein